MCNPFILQPNSAFWGFTDDSLSKWTVYVSMMGINFVQFMVLYECLIPEQSSIALKCWVWGDVQAVTAMVQQAMQYIAETPTVEARIELIETLNTVSAGKVLLHLLRNFLSFLLFELFHDVHV